MNKKIETVIKRVQESPSSVFTKEDVLNLLESAKDQGESFGDFVLNTMREEGKEKTPQICNTAYHMMYPM